MPKNDHFAFIKEARERLFSGVSELCKIMDFPPLFFYDERATGIPALLKREQPDVYANRKLPLHDLKAPGEVMLAVRFPDAPKTILSYLDGDVAETKALPSDMRSQFRLFGGTIEDVLLPVATRVATLILSGEAKEVEEAIALAKKHPDILRCRVNARDHLERAVEGTPLQIAAMAGDVNLQDDKEIKREEDRGVVERLASIEGGLSQKEVTEQLNTVITGDVAQRENERRNRCIVDAVKTFGENILRKASEYKNDKNNHENFRDFQRFCQPCINKLEQALRPSSNETIKTGYIFDPTILEELAEWFEKNVRRFRVREFERNDGFFSEDCGWWGIVSGVFWVNGFEMLHLRLSARDRHVMRHGIDSVVDGKQIPARHYNYNGTSILNSSFGCGREFYSGYERLVRADGLRSIRWDREIYCRHKKYVEQKTAALQKLCNAPSRPNRAGVQ